MTTKLGLPTISTSYGTSGDIKAWSDLNSDQMNYLVQIRPPGDVIINLIRQMIERQNMTSAVILHDERFGNLLNLCKNTQNYRYTIIQNFENVICFFFLIQIL